MKSVNEDERLADTLPTLQQLALVHAPQALRRPTLALFALDARLAGIVRNSREPMLAQLRLSWWREQLARDAGLWPQGEPLLALLRTWNGAHPALAALVDGWEALTGAAPLPEAAFLAMAQGRGAAFAALADVAGLPHLGEPALRMGTNWALADLSQRVGNTMERDVVHALATRQDWRPKRLPRPLRPLAVLHGLAARGLARNQPPGAVSRGDAFAALRIGLLGR